MEKTTTPLNIKDTPISVDVTASAQWKTPQKKKKGPFLQKKFIAKNSSKPTQYLMW